MTNQVIDLKTRQIDEWGRSVLKPAGLFETWYSGKEVVGLVQETKATSRYHELVQLFDVDFPKLSFPKDPGISSQEFHEFLQGDWFIPEPVKSLDLATHLINLCDNQVEKDRVTFELELFEERNMANTLKFLIYLVDVMRKNNIIWGIGRGSSVSSFILYKIGIHKINSLKFNLDITEFLR